MKLQQRFSRKIGKIEYVKWIITIPPKIVETLGWHKDQELEYKTNGEKLVISPIKKQGK
jgi:bifunctional DNA-binding transcriptional regulator/antitoxin component of YhaV-PrlF toxin-antitoxin module